MRRRHLLLEKVPHATGELLDLAERRERLLVVTLSVEQQQLDFGEHRCERVRQIVPQAANLIFQRGGSRHSINERYKSRKW